MIEGKGANISYQAVPFGTCDPGWIEGENGNCYRYVDVKPRSNWAEAQNQCSEQQSNLASIRTEDEFQFFKSELKLKVKGSHVF
uniref:C-type lectin domain-containing protein n=1 Tax=Heterorhabditis bacteriophora TaxID=37862 RepID=A0A1I7WHL9_HETBA